MPRQAYYAARAIDERRQSQSAADARTAAVHAELSAHYEALAANPNLEPPAGDQPLEIDWAVRRRPCGTRGLTSEAPRLKLGSARSATDAESTGTPRAATAVRSRDDAASPRRPRHPGLDPGTRESRKPSSAVRSTAPPRVCIG